VPELISKLRARLAPPHLDGCRGQRV